jgi:cytochrome c553
MARGQRHLSGLSWRALPLAGVLALALGLTAPGATAATAASAAPHADAAKGREMASQICAGCHNADGNSTIPGNPRLAGLDASYLVKQLTDLARPAGDKAGRENPVMGSFAGMLSASDRANVAAWFSHQKPASLAAHADTEGQRLWRAGDPEHGVPACAACHGLTGEGLPPLSPRLAGQHADYLEAQLRAFREGTRRNSVWMAQIATRLSDRQIKAIARAAQSFRPDAAPTQVARAP